MSSEKVSSYLEKIRKQARLNAEENIAKLRASIKASKEAFEETFKEASKEASNLAKKKDISVEEYQKWSGTPEHEEQMEDLETLLNHSSVIDAINIEEYWKTKDYCSWLELKDFVGILKNVQKAFDDEVKQYNQFMIAEAIGRKRIQAIKSSKEDALNSYILNMIDDSIHKPQTQ